MRIAILADIHGNLPAFEAALDHASRQRVDRTIVAGDIVNGSPDSAACWRLARSLGYPIVRGNHERYVARYGTAAGDPAWLSEQFAPVRWTLWLGGTAILLYLAYKMIRESMHKQLDFNAVDTPLTQSETLKLIGRGMALALSSPSALLWFATVGGSVIASHTSSQSAMVPFFAGFFVAGVVFSGVIAYISGQGRRHLSPAWVRGLALASAALFLYFAIKVFVEGYATFVINV